MTIYLLETTLVLAVALLASRLPRLAARTRHAIIFAALIKCSLPSELITYAMNHLGMAPSKGLIAFTVIGTAASALPVSEMSRSQPWLAQALIAVWVLIAATLIQNAIVRAVKTWRTAMANTEPCAARERAALTRAKVRVGLTRPVAIVRSPFASAPAAIGIRRPIILLPLDGCDALDEDELTAILTHECAHVRRRDNLLGLIEIVIAGALWFHPLVWLSRRILAQTREVACDESALGATTPDTYLHALTKLARGVVAPPLPAVSCMAASNLQERMRHIMQYRTSRLFSHRVVASSAAILLAAFTLTTGAVRAADGSKPPSKAMFTMQFTVEERGASGILIEAQVLDAAGKVVKTSRVSTHAGTVASIRTDPDPDGVSFWIKFNGTLAKFRVLKNDEVVSEEVVQGRLSPSRASPRSRSSTASSTSCGGCAMPSEAKDGINLDLAGADFRDVMRTFGQLANVKINVEPGIDTTVTV